MEYGLIAAIGWGLSSVAATYAARRMGTLSALLASQVTGTIVLTAVLAAIRPHLLALPGTAVLGLAGAGFLSLIGWLTYYRALEYGPVGIVSGNRGHLRRRHRAAGHAGSRRAARHVRRPRRCARDRGRRRGGHAGHYRAVGRRLAAGHGAAMGRGERQPPAATARSGGPGPAAP